MIFLSGGILVQWTLVLLCVVLVSLCVKSPSKTRHGKEPPSPARLPLLGNLLQLDLNRPDEGLCELSKKHGNVFTVHFGPKKVLVLAGYKTVKEALVNYAEKFGDRDITPLFHDCNKGKGIMLANGECWKEMRRFAISKLRDFGMGKKAIEQKIQEEIQYLMEVFQQHNGAAFDTSRPVNYASSNIICSILYGQRFDNADPEFKAHVDSANDIVTILGYASIQIYNICPWLRPVLWYWRVLMNKVNQDHDRIRQYSRDLKETLNPRQCRGFVDAFLTRMLSVEAKGQKDPLFHEDNLVYVVGNLFAAGTDTTGATICWAMLLMAKYPLIQARVHAELEREIGGRVPAAEDRKRLPYTDAVIHEIQRVASVVPISPHVTSCDVTFQGYFIEKGTSVIPLLTSVLRDEEEWERPHSFYPEHFLDGNGRFVKRDAFLAFSAGRRVCLGEGLARMELFLFFTTLLQRFCFEPPAGVSEEQLDLTPAVGFTLTPSPHKLRAILRS
ncbi:cytochrome P450 2K1-like [Engraulis encrasicolus]|uniref:cytochrome P450 2K1-like n=1 Tax=Engraulis encrasicolus TaxID=184585 RepID=UPI002FD65B8E